MVLERRRLQFVLYDQGRITPRVLLAEGERVVGAPDGSYRVVALVGFARPTSSDTQAQFDLLLVVTGQHCRKVRLASYGPLSPG